MSNKLWLGTDGTSPNDWSVAANWSPSGVPASTDSVFLQNNAVDITAGLAQSAVTLAALNIDQTYTGKIGTASAYLAIGATLCTIGNPGTGIVAAAGSPRIKLNFGSVQTAVTVVNTDTQASTDTGLPPVQLLGTHASNTCTVLGGRVGWAVGVGETSAIATLKVAGAGANVVMGSGCTLTTVTQTAGLLTINSAATTVTQTGGTLTTAGSGAITTATVSGTANLNSTGTITTLNVLNNGTANFGGNPAARTVTTPKLYRGGKIVDPLGVIVYTNGILVVQAKLADITGTDVGTNRTLSVA
jgi:hypothetical protein